MTAQAAGIGEGTGYIGLIGLLITLATLLASRSRKTGHEENTLLQNSEEVKTLRTISYNNANSITALNTAQEAMISRIEKIEDELREVAYAQARGEGREEERNRKS